MTFSTVPSLSFITMGISLLAGFVIPAVLFLFLQKKYGCKKLPFFIGCGTFFVFAIGLEGIVHSIVLGGGRAEALMANPVLYGLYGGLMAGLFEETGRLVAYKTLLKKHQADDSTALAYGAGHGGFEAFYILATGMITNIVFGIMINTGNTAALFNGLDEAKTVAMISTLQKVSATASGVYLVGVIERFSAVAYHMAASVLVWIAVRNKSKWYLFPVAIVLHTILDMIAVVTMQFGCPIAAIELIVMVYAALCCVFAWAMWKKYKSA